jgi:hypothetical protein
LYFFLERVEVIGYILFWASKFAEAPADKHPKGSYGCKVSMEVPPESERDRLHVTRAEVKLKCCKCGKRTRKFTQVCQNCGHRFCKLCKEAAGVAPLKTAN